MVSENHRVDSRLAASGSIIAVLLLAAGLRWHMLAQPVTLHPDEALFSTFGRAAAVNGEWLLPGPLDKPPLAIYANALAQVLVGEGVLAVRLPGTLAGVVLVAVIYGLARRLYGGSWGPLLAALLAASSPLALAYSPTAFTDSLMLPLAALALLLAVSGRWTASGVLLGLAFASKHQALFILPLLVVMGWAMGCLHFAGWRRFVFGFGMVLAALLVWDSVRGGTSTFAQAAVNNDPWRLIRSTEFVPRLASWFQSGGLLFGDALTAVLIVCALCAVIGRILMQRGSRSALTDLMLLAFVAGYGLLHWLVAFNTYERYLLLALPALCLLTARGLLWLADVARMTRLVRAAAAVVLTLVLVTAPRSVTQLEAERARYTGIEALAAYLNALPVATVIYDRWLGWELGFYLGQWTDKRRVYYPTPAALAEGALALREQGRRYFPVPADKPVTLWLEALRAAGFRVMLVHRQVNFVVYALDPPLDRQAS